MRHSQKMDELFETIDRVLMRRQTANRLEGLLEVLVGISEMDWTAAERDALRSRMNESFESGRFDLSPIIREKILDKFLAVSKSKTSGDNVRDDRQSDQSPTLVHTARMFDGLDENRINSQRSRFNVPPPPLVIR